MHYYDKFECINSYEYDVVQNIIMAQRLNKIINAGQTVVQLLCDRFECYGTPDQLLNFHDKY